ncbi:tryptophan biosynthesis modulator TrpM [Streptomyces sp. NPDC057411]|uniref:tryptophan biosynthesis modulator TrpM n=1 Tax=unclassified Streptomyces TaxID=2593676 RepID=UPI00363609BC
MSPRRATTTSPEVSSARRTRLRTAAAPAHAPLARGCRPRGCRAPARRVHGRRVRYVIGSEPGQVNGMRWRPRRARTITHTTSA